MNDNWLTSHPNIIYQPAYRDGKQINLFIEFFVYSDRAGFYVIRSFLSDPKFRSRIIDEHIPKRCKDRLEAVHKAENVITDVLHIAKELDQLEQDRSKYNETSIEYLKISLRIGNIWNNRLENISLCIEILQRGKYLPGYFYFNEQALKYYTQGLKAVSAINWEKISDTGDVLLFEQILNTFKRILWLSEHRSGFKKAIPFDKSGFDFRAELQQWHIHARYVHASQILEELCKKDWDSVGRTEHIHDVRSYLTQYEELLTEVCDLENTIPEAKRRNTAQYEQLPDLIQGATAIAERRQEHLRADLQAIQQNLEILRTKNWSEIAQTMSPKDIEYDLETCRALLARAEEDNQALEHSDDRLDMTQYKGLLCYIKAAKETASNRGQASLRDGNEGNDRLNVSVN